ncbi:MAG: hypothetical protein IPM54_03850 [Polyangiaceae bacterium]|nr:hypothetical protein [Polyangiaceae bacterium]
MRNPASRSLTFQRVPFVLVALASFVVAPLAHAAAPKDAQLEKAIQTAMDVDFLETNFDKAEKRLRAAIDACGADKCTPELKARGLMSLGIVLAGGKKQLEDAREAFAEALTIDKNAKPAEEMRSSEVNYAYGEARKQLKLDGPAGAPAPAGRGLSHTPPVEQRLSTPLPLYVELVPELLEDAKKTTVTYLAPGAADWKTLLLKRVGEQGFGINVPCTDIKAEGDFKYHITVTDADGAIITGVGSRTEPLVTKIKQRIDGNPPSWPGFAPPEMCVAVESGPKQCLDDNQCNAGFVCQNGECAPKSDGSDDKPKGPKRNYVSLMVGTDISIFSGENVCTFDSQQNANYVCVRDDGSRYLGVPTPNIANNVNAGFSLGTIRLVAGYDRLILDNIMAGARVGFAFRTASAEGANFLPVHLEVRGSYFIGKKPFEHIGVRPFVFASGGLAQIDSGVDVEVLEDGTACGAADPHNVDSPCTTVTDADYGKPEKRVQKITAIKQAGQGFVSLGGGVQYAPIERVSLNVGLRMSLTIPVVTFVLTPEVGATVAF